jgi:hypothetical protein
MVYDWISNRNHFRVEVAHGRAASALLQIVRRWGAALNEDKTFIEEVDADNRNFVVIYITPLNDLERYNAEQALDLVNTITN